MTRTGPGALVLGANYRGLGVARSLARRGIRVWVALSDDHRLAAVSRHVERTVGFPTEGAGEQLGCLLELVSEHRLEGWTVFPTDDETAALLAAHHARLSECMIPAVPPWEVLRLAYDKRLTHQMAAELGVCQPWTAFPADRHEVLALECEFPAVLKPAVKVEANALTTAKAWRVQHRGELLARYDEACRLVPPEILMVQQLIPGGGAEQLSYAALCEDGRVIASLAALRIRQRPMDFGKASTHVVTIEEGEVADPARRLLHATRYTGIVEVEFKRDPRDGVPKLLDMNPRAWGWHTLCPGAGVDFPYLQWRLLRGDEVAPVKARPGVRWVRTSTDLPTAVEEILAGRLRAGHYLRSVRAPVEHATWAPDDPLPALVDLPLFVAIAARRANVRAKGLARRRARLGPSPPAKNGHRRRSVLILSESASLSSERRTWNRALALRRAGFDVVVVSPRAEVHHQRFDLRDGIEIHRFDRAAGRTWAGVPLGEYGLAMRDIRRLVRVLSRGRHFDVAHACGPAELLLPALLSLKRAGARLVFDYDYPAPKPYRVRPRDRAGAGELVAMACERFAFALADVVLSPNESSDHVLYAAYARALGLRSLGPVAEPSDVPAAALS